MNDYFTFFYVKHFELPMCMKCAIQINLPKLTLQMYVNSSLTAQRIQKFVLVLGSFGLETATHHNPWLREKSVWVSIVQLEVSLDSGEEAGTLSGSWHHLL